MTPTFSYVLLIMLATVPAAQGFRPDRFPTRRKLTTKCAVPNPENNPDIFEPANFYERKYCADEEEEEEEEICELPGYFCTLYRDVFTSKLKLA